jgi:hypothetical protein
MTASKLIDNLLCYGISAISLDTAGSDRNDGLRACVSQVPRSMFGDLEYRLKRFNNDHPVNKK